MTREFINTLATLAAGYCADRDCASCTASFICFNEFGHVVPNIDDWEQCILRKLNKETYKDAYGDSDGRHR